MLRYVTKNKGLFFLVVVVLASFLWMTSQARHPRARTGVVEKAVSFVSYPVVKAVDRAIATVKGVWVGYFYLVGLEKENNRLTRQNGQLLQENIKFRQEVAKERRLSDLWELKEDSAYPVTAARAVGRDASTWFKSIWINKGEGSGIRKNMPAAVYTGVVGKVFKTYGGISRLLLITDPASAVSCITERTREPGILVGEGGGGLRMLYVGKHADIKEGDLIITSGLDGIFPKDMAAGVVTRVSKSAPGYFMEVDAAPTADIAHLEEVLIMKYEPVELPREPEQPAAEKGKR